VKIKRAVLTAGICPRQFAGHSKLNYLAYNIARDVIVEFHILIDDIEG